MPESKVKTPNYDKCTQIDSLRRSISGNFPSFNDLEGSWFRIFVFFLVSEF